MTASTIRTHVRAARWRLLALVLIAITAVPVVRAANQLRLHVDGDVLDVLSFESTVGGLLDEQGVEVAAGDEILPAVATPLEDVSAITILRTIDVTLVVDGEATVHTGTWRTVEGMLAELEVPIGPTQTLRPGPRTPLADGDRVTIRSAVDVDVAVDDDVRSVRTHLATVGRLLDNVGVEVGDNQRLLVARGEELTDGMVVDIATALPVQIVADGRSRTVDTFTDSVSSLLDEAGVTLAAADMVEPALTSGLDEDTTVTVRRVTFDEVVEEVAVPFDVERRTTNDLYTGESRVAREGTAGVRAETYRVRYVDGEQDARELLDSEVRSQPTDQVVEVGTKERPAPPPPPPAPAAPSSSGSSSSSSGSGVWYDLARCESGLRWDYNGSSGYDGGLQFLPSTWTATKPAGYPAYAWQATAGQQIEVAKILQARAGWGQWPACASKLGLR